MPIKSSIFQQILIFYFLTLALALNPARAEKDADYLNALGDEAKLTKMKEQKPVLEKAPEPAVIPNKSTDIDKLTYNVIKDLKKTMGISEQTDGTKATVEDELEKMVSTALKQGNSMDDIRSAVNEAMTDLKTQPEAIEPKTLESVSKALTQIVGKSKDPTTDNSSDNIPLSKKPSSKQANNSNITAMMKPASIERTVTVSEGDSLSKIALRVYGSDKHHTLLYEANQDIITDPDVIQIGQVLKIPEIP